MHIEFETTCGRQISAVAPRIILVKEPKSDYETTIRYHVTIGENNNIWPVSAEEYERLKKEIKNQNKDLT